MMIDRYILRLLLGPFLGFLAIVMGVLLLSRALKVLDIVAEKGADWHVLGIMLLAVIPYFLVLTLPIAFFFALQNVVVSLGQNSESDAFRAAGVSWLRLGRAPLLLALLISGLLLYDTAEWMPRGQKLFTSLLYALQQSKPIPSFDPQRFNQELEDFTIYVDGQDGAGNYVGFLLEDNREATPVTYIAQKARLERSGEALNFILSHGARIEGRHGNVRTLAFAEYAVAIGAADLGLLRLPKWSNSIGEMSLSELRQTRQTKDSAEARAEWNRRLLLPTTVLLLLLYALPLSVAPKRSGKSGAYILGAALLLLVFNTQVALFQKVSSGAFPAWSMWGGQLLLAAVGLWLTLRVNRDRQVSLLGWLTPLFDRVGRAVRRRISPVSPPA